MNTIGHLFRLTSFGESHGLGVGGIIDGCPAGLSLDLAQVQKELARRRPGQSALTTPRNEQDKIELLSGVFDGKTTGTPIGFLIYNKDSNPKDYDELKKLYRPSHADYTFDAKYGFRDHRGGGRSSARETIARVVGGAIAKQLLEAWGIQVWAYTKQVHKIKLTKSYQELDLTTVDNTPVRCPDPETAEKMIEHIQKAKKEGDSLGGIISCVIQGVPAGLGEPVFDKLHADLGKAILSINAVKGFEYGLGFDAVNYTGKEHNDEFELQDGAVHTSSNRSGGIQGGISNGEDIYFNAIFKPTATIFKTQQTVNQDHETITYSPKGRHDPCVLPRAIPIVEAMAAMTIVDHILLNQTSQLNYIKKSLS